eukprot:TRINITY_DN22986_c0_g1_i1.p1 TRINITY_DN22986_c0_g1~~TRINITY_DN22986_c0_g1_i1.p1  ORF type:complete len:874 (-),score=169.52 TRINITY_DN22986_c0_g1_i1:272-2893(-)
MTVPRSYIHGDMTAPPRFSKSLSECSTPSKSGWREESYWKKLAWHVRMSVWGQAIFLTAVGLSLVAPRIVLLADIPQVAGTVIIDVIMFVALLCFTSELIVHCWTSPDFMWGFFFWADVLGTLSLLFEISFLIGNVVEQSRLQTYMIFSHLQLLRALRTCKLVCVWLASGAVCKCGDEAIAEEAHAATAQRLTIVLANAIGVRVCILTLVVTWSSSLLNDVLSPTQQVLDAMQTFTDEIEKAYALSWDSLAQDSSKNTDTKFQKLLGSMENVMQHMPYMPYHAVGFDEEPPLHPKIGRKVVIPGIKSFQIHPTPARRQNILIVQVSECKFARVGCDGRSKAEVHFDIRKFNVRDEVAALFALVILLSSMIFFSSNLLAVVNYYIINSMERMMSKVRDGFFADLKISIPEGASEADILAEVMEKLSKVHDVHMQENIVTAAELAEMDLEERGNIMQMQPRVMKSLKFTGARDSMRKCTISEEFDSWNVNFLKEDCDVQNRFISHVFGQLQSAIPDCAFPDVESSTFTNFVIAVQGAYNSAPTVPYHNWQHALTVLHGSHRIINISRTTTWLNHIHTYALMVAAMCHDMGHQGRTNNFLIETRHEWALLYNDNSPLENMHAASLFRTLADKEADIFKELSDQTYKEVRKVCVSSILHTDVAKHFDIVKDVNTFYEVNEMVCERQAHQLNGLNPEYEHMLRSRDSTFIPDMVLHLSDLSNPLLPFETSEQWAMLVMEEFFAQGDEERSLGIPLGMLNDREKVSRYGSQHGFITFLVAPFVIGVVKIFPPLHGLAIQMGQNMYQWRDLWVEETGPQSDITAKRDEDIKRINDASWDLHPSHRIAHRSSHNLSSTNTNPHGHHTYHRMTNANGPIAKE